MPKARRMAALGSAIALLSTIVLGLGTAQAQTVGYPPGTTTTVSCVPGNVNAGTAVVGQTVTLDLCGGFLNGATVAVTVNGTTVPAKTAVNGAVTAVITVESTTVLSVNDPTNVAAVCGTNTVKATGSGTPGASTGTFNLTCSTTTTANSGLALTGANVARGAAIAFLLIGLGIVLVLLQRRRRQTI